MRANAAEQERIAVGRGIGDAVHPDDAGRAGRILDQHLLAQNLAHACRNDPAHDVERASRGERHHHDDRPRWIGLRPRRYRPCPGRANDRFDEIAPSHAASVGCGPNSATIISRRVTVVRGVGGSEERVPRRRNV